MTEDELRRLFESHSAEIRRHFDVSTEEVKRECAFSLKGLRVSMKNSIATVCEQFNTHRMVGEYLHNYYLPASRV